MLPPVLLGVNGDEGALFSPLSNDTAVPEPIVDAGCALHASAAVPTGEFDDAAGLTRFLTTQYNHTAGWWTEFARVVEGFFGYFRVVCAFDNVTVFHLNSAGLVPCRSCR